MPAKADGAASDADAEDCQDVANALASALILASHIELLPGSAISAPGDTPQRVDGLVAHAMPGNDAIGAMHGSDLSDRETCA
jgi:hypothetical protein